MFTKKSDDYSKSIDTLLSDKTSNLSHEIRTRLSTILGFLDILGTEDLGPLNNNQHEAISRIDKSSGKLKDSLNEILISADREAKNKIEFSTLQVNIKTHAWLIRGLFATLVLSVGWVLSERSELLEDVESLFRKSSLRTEIAIDKLENDIERHLESHEYHSREELRRLRDKIDNRE